MSFLFESLLARRQALGFSHPSSSCPSVWGRSERMTEKRTILVQYDAHIGGNKRT